MEDTFAKELTVKNESREFRDYAAELSARLPEYARRAASVEPETEGSIEWCGRIGKFWWQAREQKGLSRYQVAEKMAVNVNQVRFMEVGFNDLTDLSNDFFVSYAQALDRPELYKEFCRRFTLPKR